MAGERYGGSVRATGRNARRLLGRVRNAALATCLVASAAAADTGQDEAGQWWVGFFTGVMTDGKAHNALNPFTVEFVDEYVAGFALGYERRLGDTRFSYGIEAQLNAHFGSQGFYEIAVPAVIRYHPEKSWFDAFESFAFALGPSHYSEISRLERDNYGESRRNLFYWYLEAEFRTDDPDTSIFARVHHRSNAWGTLMPDGGSNALVVGIRRNF